MLTALSSDPEYAPKGIMHNITIYREVGRYGGWPANYGIWSWGNEIVVGFVAGYHKMVMNAHASDKSKPFTTMQARSLDGGLSWDVQPMPVLSPGNRALSADEHADPELKLRTALEMGEINIPQPCPGGIQFNHPDFAMMCARTGLGAGTTSWFYTSTDRCRSWAGPYALPMFRQVGIEARTDAHVIDENTCLLFLTASKASGAEGKGVFCARTTDGGKTFHFLSWVTQVEEGFAIMPSSVRLSDGKWRSAVRRHGSGVDGAQRNWIDLLVSEDGAMSWRYLSQPEVDTGHGGNPPALMRLQDGRLCLTYGYRNPPYGIRARLSENDGMSWSSPIILREDGGSPDLGYPRSVQRPDGKMVAVYYFNDEPGGAAYIAGTIWQP